MTAVFEPLYSDGDSCAGRIGPVLVFVARGRPNASQVPLVHEWGERLRRQHPTAGGFIVVVASNAPVPDERERGYMRACFEAIGKYVQVVGMVIEGEGFMAAALRGAATAVTLVMRTPFALKTFGSTYAASAYVLSKLPADIRLTPHQLTYQIAAMRREHERGTLLPARKQPVR